MGALDVIGCCSLTQSLRATGTVNGLSGSLYVEAQTSECSSAQCRYYRVEEAGTLQLTLIEDGRVLRVCPQGDRCTDFARQ